MNKVGESCQCLSIPRLFLEFPSLLPLGRGLLPAEGARAARGGRVLDLVGLGRADGLERGEELDEDGLQEAVPDKERQGDQDAGDAHHRGGKGGLELEGGIGGVITCSLQVTVIFYGESI